MHVPAHRAARHVTPLPAIWALNAMWFTTGDNEQKAKNLSANQHGALTTGTDTLTGMDYIIEGTATLVTDAVRSGSVQLYRVQSPKGFAFATGSESSQTRYRWS